MARRIMNTVPVYMILSQKTNKIQGECVFLSKECAEKEKYEYDCNGYDVYVDSVLLPFAGKYVSYINIYRGFNYNYGSTSNPIYDVVNESKLFASVELAKQDICWQNIIKRVEKEPDEYNIYTTKICSKDIFGANWIYGDVMEGKISAEIRKLRIVR